MTDDDPRSMSDAMNREVLVFNEALQLPLTERTHYLNEECGDDARLRRRVGELLEAHEAAGTFLEGLTRSMPGSSNEDLSLPGEKVGDRVGSYKLLQQIGEGGCGTVYMAEQEEPVRRRVAVKVIKLGMDTKQVIARFEAERQALAMMDHPNIARVFEAGATRTGRPYFVMELVRGVQLTDFCDAGQLSTESRVRLFIQVCHAIQHAHQKGIIHRDIKPTNILVPVNDGEPVPKVIDFGIAKATQGRLTDNTLFTPFEQFIGTPAYMSPEQAVLTTVEVDTQSDIYSLGVLLYELLTGQTPFAQKELLASGLDEMRRTIREKDPVRPSTRLSAMVANDLATVARNRQSQPPQLLHLVRGDLDWIVMKCLQKERGRRYETANALAMDLLRHLHHEPVLARPDTRTYRMTKFLRRNRASATLAAVVLLALIGGLTGTFTEARRATKHAALAETQRRRADAAAESAKAQRDFALRQLSRAEAINDLNTFLLTDAAPSGKPITVRDLLTRAERLIDRQSAETDDNRVELLIAIGRQFQMQDQHAKARELLGKAYEMSRKLTDPVVRAQAAASYGDAIALKGEFEEGEKLVQEALNELGSAPQFTLARISCLLRGSHLAREHGKTELGIERAKEAQRLLRDSGQGSPLLDLTVAMDVAESYRMAGWNRDAVAAFAEAFKQLSALGRDDTDKASTLLNNWAVALEKLGQPLEAERLYRQAIAIETAAGTDETVSPMLLNNLGRTLIEIQQAAQGAEYAERAEARARQAGAENVVSMCLNVRATAYRELGQLDRAADALNEFEARWTKQFPPGHIGFAAVASQRSLLNLARGNMADALTEADRAITVCEASSECRDRLAIFLVRRATVKMKLHQAASAQGDAERALTLHQEAIGTEALSSWIGRTYFVLGQALEARGKREEARTAYTAAVKHLEVSLGKNHPETLEAAGSL
jgi:eukaryotic-like serine/threonine-protein kinase